MLEGGRRLNSGTPGRQEGSSFREGFKFEIKLVVGIDIYFFADHLAMISVKSIEFGKYDSPIFLAFNLKESVFGKKAGCFNNINYCRWYWRYTLLTYRKAAYTYT